MGVSNHLTRSELKCQSKVANAGGHVTLENDISSLCSCYDEEEDNCAGFDEEKVHLDEDVLGLEIPVGDRWLQTLPLVGSKLT